jgi:hypothetical protein
MLDQKRLTLVARHFEPIAGEPLYASGDYLGPLWELAENVVQEDPAREDADASHNEDEIARRTAIALAVICYGRITPEPAMIEVILPNGDRAKTEDEAGALLAARTLIEEASIAAGGARKLRAGLVVTRGGQYDGRLTEACKR